MTTTDRRLHVSGALAKALLVVVAASAMRATQAPPPANAAAASVTQLADGPTVRAALDFIRKNEPDVLNEQARLCAIAAPPFMEGQRAEAYRAAFERLGLQHVRIDAVGNVLGERPGRQAKPLLVMSAHLDTVFPEGTDVKTTRTGTTMAGPGIADDCRGLAVVLGVIQAMAAARIETEGTVLFVGTVGEEGLGDLRGVKHLFAKELAGRIDAFVSVDGAGSSITRTAVGSRRYRVTIKGPGGHSFGDFGMANPVHAIGRAVAAVAAIEVPQAPKTTFNVGRIGGGTSVNSIAAEAWMEIDLRSADRASLASLDQRVVQALDRALADENARWGNRGRLTMDRKLVGDRPAGGTAADAPIVRAALEASRLVGLAASVEEGSTDANLAMSLGIPAITVDGGGAGQGSHSLDERFDSTDSWKGTARTLLLTVALAR